MTNWEVLKASQFTLEFKVLKYEGGDYCLGLLGQYEGTYYLTHKNDLLVITFTDSTSLSMPAKRSHLSKDDPMDGKPPLWNNDYVVSNESFNVLTSKNVQSICAIDQKKKKPYTYLVDPEKQAMIKNALLLVK